MRLHLQSKHPRSTGALMASALMLMLVAGMLVSGWMNLMSTRAVQVSYLEDICRRRVGLESSRLLAHEFAADRAFRIEDDLSPNQSFVLGSDIGGINSFDGWNDLNIYGSTSWPGSGLSTVYPYNYTGLHPGASFLHTERIARPPAVAAGNIDNFTAWHFLKTLPPVLAGDVFCIYRKPDGVSTELDVYRNVVTGAGGGHHANWVVNGRTVLRHPPSLFVRSTPSPLELPFRTKSLYIQSSTAAVPPTLPEPVHGVDLDGRDLAPSNLPAVPSTTGPVSAGGDQRYEGWLNVIKNDNNTHNSLWHFQQREKDAGRTDIVTIDVAAPFNSATEAYWISHQANPTFPPAGWPSGYDSKLKVLFIKLDSVHLKHMRVTGVVDQIIFVGQSNNAAFQAAAGMKPIIITVMPAGTRGRWVRDVRFERENARRFVLAFQDDLGRTVDFSWINGPFSGTDYRWRCVLVNEYQTIMFNMPALLTQNVRWIGGVMTNWTIKRRAAGGTNASRLTFTPDTDAAVPQTAPAGLSFAHFLPRDAWQEALLTP